MLPSITDLGNLLIQAKEIADDDQKREIEKSQRQLIEVADRITQFHKAWNSIEWNIFYNTEVPMVKNILKNLNK